MDQRETERLWARGVGLLRTHEQARFKDYVKELKARGGDHRALAWLLETEELVEKYDVVAVLKLARRIISKTKNPSILIVAQSYVGWALGNMGDAAKAEHVFAKLLEMSALVPGFRQQASVVMAMHHIYMGEIYEARKILPALKGLSGATLKKALQAHVFLELIAGNFVRVITLLKDFEGFEDDVVLSESPDDVSLYELLGDAHQALGNIQRAVDIYKGLLDRCIQSENAYAIFLVNKLHRLRLLGATDWRVPKTLDKRARTLASKGSLMGKAGLTEHKAHALWDMDQSQEAIAKLLEAGELCGMAKQNIEALSVYLMATYLARQAESSLFWRGLEHLKPKMEIYRNYALGHFLWRDFVQIVEPLMGDMARSPKVKIYLFGSMRAQGFKEPARWHSKKALLLLKYLLLNHGKALAGEYLAYLLWPRANPQRAGTRLYTAVGAARRELGPWGSLLVCRSKTYTLQEDPRLWVDTSQFQQLLREAEALSQNPNLQLEKYLKALELYTGPLLPEDRYDRYIEEYRDYFHKKFQRALAKAVELLIKQAREDEAISLAERFYLRFPKDDPVAKIYLDLLVKAGRRQEAERLYDEFKRRLWREHRAKPSFEVRQH